MRRIITLSLAGTLSIFSAFSQSAKPKTTTKPATTNSANGGYNLPVTVAPLKNCWVYIGCYYGKFKNLVDSAWLDNNSTGVFKGKAKLTEGIYFLVSPKHSILTEFLMDKPQRFSIKADTLHLETASITGSADNDLFQQYTKYLSTKGPQLNALQSQYKEAKTIADSTRIRDEIIAGNKELTDYRENVIKQHPESLLTFLLQAMKRPEVPAMPKLPNGKLDSTYPYRFVKEHYWDDVSFEDDRLLRTPFFEPKVDEYFKYYVSPEPDSVIQEVNYILLSARTGKDMFKYMLGKFTDKYINPEIMGQDKVFVFLFNNYFSKGDTTWLSAKQKEFIFNRAYSLMANQIGEAAAPMDLVDTSGKAVPLYGLNAPFTFVLFWDHTCGHCKEEVPRIDSIFEAKWKKMGVKIYAVNVNADEHIMEPWKKFIIDSKLKGWTHVYELKKQRDADNAAGRANFRQLYDVFQTPTMYLLDKDKHIIAKKLTLEQFDEVMQAKLKAQASK